MTLTWNNSQPRKRQLFAVTTGTYVGEMLCFIKQDASNFYFLSLPKNENRKIPKEKFEFGLKNNIIEFVEQVPRYVYKVITAQFTQNENSSNRR